MTDTPIQYQIGSNVDVRLDVANSGTYSHLFSGNITTTITRKLNTNNAEVPDRNDLTKPVQVINVAKSSEFSFSTNGTLDFADVGVYDAVAFAGKPVKFELVITAPDSSTSNAATYLGSALLSNFVIGAPRDNLMTVQFDFLQAGPVSNAVIS